MRGRILVVDDNAESLKLYVKFLAAKGYEVDAAASALEADRAFERALPALVLVDVALPGEDGLSWVRRVKGHHESPPRFVAVTAYCTPDAKARALDAGCHAFAAKPTPLKDLLELVRAQMGASGGQDLQPGLV